MHLFHGGHGDVTVDAPLKDYSVLLYCRDAKGKKMVIRTMRLNGKVQNNLKIVVDDCAKEEIKKITVKTPTDPKQVARAERFRVPHIVDYVKDRTLWIEAKVVPKAAEFAQPDEATSTNEPVDTKTFMKIIDAFVQPVAINDSGSADKSDEWDVVVNKED